MLNFYSLSVERDISARYKEAKYARARFGPLIKFAILVSPLVSFYAMPLVMIYFNVDPIVLLNKQIFEALPIIPYLFSYISPNLLPLVCLGVRYLTVVAYALEYQRMIVLAQIIVYIFFGQSHDALDFQEELFNKSKSRESQIALKYVLKYREMLIIRDSFYPLINFGVLSLLFVAILFLITLNYLIIRMYTQLSAVLLGILLLGLLIAVFVLKSTLNEGANVEHISLEQLRRFQMGTRSIRQRKDIRYVMKAVKSLPPISFYIGLPGFDFLKMDNSTTRDAFMFVVDQTVTVLLTF